MIRLKASSTDTPAELQAMLQVAIQLEMSTLPPYLYAFYTVGENPEARMRLRQIVLQEMIHLGLACNILNAIDGAPLIADASVVPTYPGPLPNSIGDGLVVHLLPFSIDAMQQGMAIEEPEDPIVFALAAADPDTQTIGQFYDSLKEPLTTLPLTWDAHPERQVSEFGSQVFPVHEAADAVRAIDAIVAEGEGTPDTPVDPAGDLAHYYLFQEMARDQLLQPDPSAPHGFVWGPSLSIDWDAAVAAVSDPTTHDLSGFPDIQAGLDACDKAFTSVLDLLQAGFNGDPDSVGTAVGAMFDISSAAQSLLELTFGTPGLAVGPAFRYRPELLG